MEPETANCPKVFTFCGRDRRFILIIHYRLALLSASGLCFWLKDLSACALLTNGGLGVDKSLAINKEGRFKTTQLLRPLF